MKLDVEDILLFVEKMEKTDREAFYRQYSFFKDNYSKNYKFDAVEMAYFSFITLRSQADRTFRSLKKLNLTDYEIEKFIEGLK